MHVSFVGGGDHPTDDGRLLVATGPVKYVYFTVLGQLGRTVEQSVLWRRPLIFGMRKAEIFASLVKALAVGQPLYFSPELARHCSTLLVA